MGASTERIAIEVTASADVSAVRQARAELSDAGQAARAANEAVAQSAARAAAAEKSATSAVSDAARATNTLAVSREQMRDALVKTGGDLAKAAELIARETAAQQALAKATDQATDAAKRQAGTTGTPAGQAAGAAAAGISGMPPAVARASAEVDKLTPKLRTAANATAILGQAAVSGTGSVAGMAVAAGNLAAGLSTLATTAKAAAVTTGIGALVAVIGTVAGLTISYRDKTKELKREIADTADEARGMSKALAGDDLGQRIAQLNRAADSEIAKVKEINFHASERAALEAAIIERRDKQIEVARRQAEEERSQLVRSRAAEASAQQRTIDLEETRRSQNLDAFRLQIAAANKTQKDAEAEIRQQFVRRSALGVVLGLSREEVALRDRLIEQTKTLAAQEINRAAEELRNRKAEMAITLLGLSDDPRDQARARELEIRREQIETVKATGLRVEAEQVAELKIRALRRQTIQEGLAGYQRLAENSKIYGKVATAVAQSIADAVRKFEILVQARKDAIKAKSEFAAGLASLGAHDFWGAGQHFAASAGFAASAAAGGAEALGGGGGGAGGGGGGQQSTFEPRSSGQGAGDFTLVIQTVDKDSGQIVRQTKARIAREDALNRPLLVSLPLNSAPTLSYGF
jgi:hypothetical protein